MEGGEERVMWPAIIREKMSAKTPPLFRHPWLSVLSFVLTRNAVYQLFFL